MPQSTAATGSSSSVPTTTPTATKPEPLTQPPEPFPFDKKFYRQIIIAKKRLPEPEKFEKFWGFVEKASPNLNDLEHDWGRTEYDTLTRGVLFFVYFIQLIIWYKILNQLSILGHRFVDPMRLFAAGVYSIVAVGRQTNLVYELELPKEMGQVQNEFRVEKEGSLILSIKVG